MGSARRDHGGLCQRLAGLGALDRLRRSRLLGTLSIHLANLVYLLFSTSPLDPVEALNLITIPSILLNLIFILPIYAIMGELHKLIFPLENQA
jgi:hypothetical protein